MDLRDIKEFFRDFMGYIITFAIVIFIFTFIVSFHPIAGNSMVPSLEEGNIIMVSKFTHRFFDIKRNKIVIIKKDGKSYVKRIIGLPGENIKFLNNVLYINGKGYSESFLGDVTTDDFDLKNICNVDLCSDDKIPNNYYFVLGDNRNNSKDSRSSDFGLVHIDEIQGIGVFKMWPINDLSKI